MSHYVWSQANITAFDIGFDIVAEDWLAVFLDNQLLDLFNSKIASQWVLMMFADQLYINNFKYIW